VPAKRVAFTYCFFRERVTEAFSLSCVNIVRSIDDAVRAFLVRVSAIELGHLRVALSVHENVFPSVVTDKGKLVRLYADHLAVRGMKIGVQFVSSTNCAPEYVVQRCNSGDLRAGEAAERVEEGIVNDTEERIENNLETV
jgi:hypothetical protein